MAGFIKTLIALGFSILALIMPGAVKAEEGNILYPTNAAPPQINTRATTTKPSFNLCFKMPNITGPTDAVFINQSNINMAVKGCSGPVDLKLHLVANTPQGNPTLETYSITSLPWTQNQNLKNGAYTLFLQNTGNTTQYDSFHFEVSKLN